MKRFDPVNKKQKQRGRAGDRRGCINGIWEVGVGGCLKHRGKVANSAISSNEKNGGHTYVCAFTLTKSLMTKHVCLLSDIDECAVRPCQNGGNCTDAVNDYDCNCAAGYSGRNCTIGKNDVLSKKIIL